MKKKLALVLHGYPGPSLSIREVENFLKTLRFDVIAPEYLQRDKFEVENTAEWIKKNLGSRRPDLIVGLSLGGLVLPYVAKYYPQAKLVFIATGEKVKSPFNWVNKIINLVDRPAGELIVKLLTLLPVSFLEIGYVIVQNVMNKKVDKKELAKRRKEAAKALQQLGADKHMEIIRFMKKCDNSEILRRLKNKTLIISGTSDTLMSTQRGRALGLLLQNSKLTTVPGVHYNVVNRFSLEKIGKFIGE